MNIRLPSRNGATRALTDVEVEFEIAAQAKGDSP
jgi:hypothetical protein